MVDIDKELENLVDEHFPAPCDYLAAALLRAREKLTMWHLGMHRGAPCMKLNPCPCLADTELEEALNDL